MDYEGFVAQGTMLGSGGVIVIDDAQNLVKQIARAARFFAHESCAQCTQCREGTAWTTKILERIVAGEGTTEDLDTLLEIGDNMTGKTICVLSDSCAMPVVSGHQEIPRRVRGAHQDEADDPRARRWPEWQTRAMVRNAHDRGTAGHRARGHLDSRGGEARGRAHPALLLPPGTAGRRRVPDVPRRGREGAEARARRARRPWPKGRSSTCTPRRRSRRARACSRCCSSTTRSIARSAIRRASASCRTTRTRKGARGPLPRPEALQSGRGLRRRRDVRRRTAASSARGACASWTTSRTIRCST